MYVSGLGDSDRQKKEAAQADRGRIGEEQ